MSESTAGKGDRDRSDPTKYQKGLGPIKGFSWSDPRPFEETANWHKKKIDQVLIDAMNNPNNPNG